MVTRLIQTKPYVMETESFLIQQWRTEDQRYDIYFVYHRTRCIRRFSFERTWKNRLLEIDDNVDISCLVFAFIKSFIFGWYRQWKRGLIK